jgi:hypothetical protein
MKGVLIFVLASILIGTAKGQEQFRLSIDSAYTNSLRGIFYALENIPERKNSISKDLIRKNRLTARIKISKEIGGVFVQSTGFFDTYKVTTEIYRDYKSLKTEGLIDYIPRKE